MKISRAWDRSLQLLTLNEEFQVFRPHQGLKITSLPFVHTARRCPGLSCFEKRGDCWLREVRLTFLVETALIAVA